MRESLQGRLGALDPKAAQALLRSIWRNFFGSEEHEALMLALAHLRTEALGILLGPATGTDERTHAAGVVYATEKITETISEGAGDREIEIVEPPRPEVLVPETGPEGMPQGFQEDYTLG